MAENSDTINGTKYHHSVEYNDLRDDDNKLKEFFQLQIDALKESTSKEDANLKESYLLAIKLLDEHQKASNNLQELIRTQTIEHDKQLLLYLPINEYERRHQAIVEQINKQEINQIQFAAKADQKDVDEKLLKAQEVSSRKFTETHKYQIITAIIAIISLGFAVGAYILDYLQKLPTIH